MKLTCPTCGGKLQTVIDAQPEWAVSLVRRTDKDRLDISEADYKKYTEALELVPKALEVLLAEGKYIKHESLTAEDLMTILQATDGLVDAILIKDYAQEA